MLTPEYLQSVPDSLLELYAQVEADILADMARRINGYDYFIPAAQHQLQVLEEMGGVCEEIIGKLQIATGKSSAEMAEIMKEAGMEALRVDDAIYRAVGLAPSPLAASKTMQRLLQTGLDKTDGLFENLCRTTANTATRQFGRALDRAYMQISSGAFSSDVAIKSAIEDLCKSGVTAIDYPGGHRDTVETAVRRATITGVNQTALAMQEARADEMGCDLVEVTAHSGARPDHAVWQGEIYCRSGKSRKYPGLVEVTGYGTGEGLGGWNCSHSFRPYIDGMPRTYSKGLLDEYNAKDYEYNGVKMTQYEAMQNQRYIERNIRRWKRENLTLSGEGLDTTKSVGKLREWQERKTDFLRQTGLKQQPGREHVGGWGRNEAAKAGAEAKVFTAFANAVVGTKTSTGISITQMSTHVYDQARERGVSVEGIISALTSPLGTGKIRLDGSQQFIGEHATVAINVESGKAVTVWPTSSKRARKLMKKGAE